MRMIPLFVLLISASVGVTDDVETAGVAVETTAGAVTTTVVIADRCPPHALSRTVSATQTITMTGRRIVKAAQESTVAAPRHASSRR